MLAGVIADDGRMGVPSRLDEVRSAWSELRFHKNIMDVDIQFVSIAQRDDLGMDALIEGRMQFHFSGSFRIPESKFYSNQMLTVPGNVFKRNVPLRINSSEHCKNDTNSMKRRYESESPLMSETKTFPAESTRVFCTH